VVLLAREFFWNRAKDASRIAGNDFVRFDVFSNDAARANHGSLADLDTAENNGTGPDRCMFSDSGGNNNPILLCLQLPEAICRSGIAVVDKHHMMSDKDSIANRNAFANERVARNLTISADPHTLLYFDKGSNLTVISDFATIKVDEIVDLNAFSQRNIRRDFLRSHSRSVRRALLLLSHRH